MPGSGTVFTGGCATTAGGTVVTGLASSIATGGGRTTTGGGTVFTGPGCAMGIVFTGRSTTWPQRSEVGAAGPAGGRDGVGAGRVEMTLP